MTTLRRPVGPDDRTTIPHDVVLRAEHVSVDYDDESPIRAVRDVSFELNRGEILGIAGESGCGKSTLAYALTRLLRPPGRLTGGSVTFYGRDGSDPVDIMALDPPALRAFRWSKVSMVFQSAMNALNPVTSLRKQFADIFQAHDPGMDATSREQRSRQLLEMVGIDPGRLRAFPHELSGGMRQRVVIAMALALRPEIIVMDEPTTALDVVVQREILDEIDRLRHELRLSIIFITHDVPLLLALTDRLAVMYAGRIVEYAPSEPVALTPAHPYTYGLLKSFPDLRSGRQILRGVRGSPPDLRQPIDGCAFAPRCSFVFGPCHSVFPLLRSPWEAAPDQDSAFVEWRVACHLHDPGLRSNGPPSEIRVGFRGETTEEAADSKAPGPSLGAPRDERRPEHHESAPVGPEQGCVLEVRDLTVEFTHRNGQKVRAVDGVSFALLAGETIALVGESGSGKSTVARSIGRLIKATQGEVLLHGQAAGRRGRRLRNYRREVQLVFQDPFASLNPSFTVAHHLRRPLLINGHERAGLDDAVQDLLRSVNLEPPGVMAKKHPHELSGGQRQRVAIARALAPQPSVVLADEPVSMLDASIRLEILNLLDRLKRDRHLAVLYITHDLATARHFSSRVMVMYGGEIVENGPADDVIRKPAHPYTRLLASAVPSPNATRGELAIERQARRQSTSGSGSGADAPGAGAASGCRFRARCPHVMGVCVEHPPNFAVGPDHIARCWLYDPSRSSTPGSAQAPTDC